MTTLDGGARVDVQQEELAAHGEAPSSGIPLEAVAVVWEPLTKEQREAYERLHRYPPPGYRGTGPVEWFIRRHPDTAPCLTCGVTTDRFTLCETYIGTGGMPSATYNNHALCGLMVPWCVDCQRRASIAVLERRQQNPEILAHVLVGEAAYLTELRA